MTRDGLRRIYARQFREMAPLRRHICSLLPLNSISTIFEPGCGSGLLGIELQSLTNAAYTGMDIDPDVLPERPGFILGDALEDTPPADLYAASFFFSSVPRPVPWLKKVRRAMPPGGLFALFGEYDYESIGEIPDEGIASALTRALERDGLTTTHGGRLDRFFETAGFTKLHGADVRSDPQEPDGDFLAMNLDSLPDPLPLMTWRIVWGIWRTGV